MDEKSHMKLWIIILAAVFIVVAAAGVYTAMNKMDAKENKTNDTDLGTIMINWYFPEFPQLVDNSDLIVVATVTGEKGVWDTPDGQKPANMTEYKDNYGQISTEYTFQTDDILKGTVNDTFTGRVKGGTLDGYTFTAQKVPTFENNDTVLLFIQYPKDENGTVIQQNYVQIGFPNAFIETANGNFTSEYYGDVTLTQVKEEIAS
ncbi:hypothetical protein MsAg5_07070 [Methanosarcinaceae archaeon Ag5]|uniref:Uncharacterized protein n=1 Tax=Methanolapillus africanus TaxID=3028297 RepID=A0AAE4MJM1_9EURY|nr:hypothetical protein [Methanosarcinaceae archaeon Ag5]